MVRVTEHFDSLVSHDDLVAIALGDIHGLMVREAQRKEIFAEIAAAQTPQEIDAAVARLQSKTERGLNGLG